MHFKLKFSEEAEIKLKEIEQDRSNWTLAIRSIPRGINGKECILGIG